MHSPHDPNPAAKSAAAAPAKKGKQPSNLRQRTPGGNYTFRAQVNGKDTWISTGTNNVAIAKGERAKMLKKIEEARRTGRWEMVGLLKLRTDLPTLAELEEKYLERIGKESVRAPGLSARKDYWRRLRAVVSCARGEDAEAAKDLPLTILAGDAGAELVKCFRENWLAGVAEEDLEAQASRRRSGDSMLRQARSCFGRAALRCYKEWALPDLKGFMEGGGGFGSVAPSHQDIAPGVLAAMAEAADKLRDENPRLYIVHLAHKLLGLRNSELAEARVGWFQAVRWESEKPVQWMMEISERCGYRPKASEGSVPLRREVAAELAKAWKALGIDPSGDPLQFMVPARTETERHNVLYYEHAEFIRRFLPAADFAKAGYELRRWAFRQVQAKYGSREAARAFVRHAMPADAGRHYQARFYPWHTLGDDVGISLLEARGGAASMATAEVVRSAWEDL